MEEEVANAELVLEQTRYELALALSSFDLAMGITEERYLAAGPNNHRGFESPPLRQVILPTVVSGHLG